MENSAYKKPPSLGEQLSYSFLSGLIFLVIASPITYRLIRSLFNIINPSLGNYVATAKGLATRGGLLLHAFIFSMIVFFSMVVISSINEEYTMF